MASKVTQYLSEELGEGAGSSGASDADTAAARRRTLLAALGQRGADLLGLQLQSVSHYLQQGMQQAAAAATCLLYTSPSPRDRTRSRMPSSA